MADALRFIHPTGYSLVDGNTSYNNNLGNTGAANITACTTCVLGDNVAP